MKKFLISLLLLLPLTLIAQKNYSTPDGIFRVINDSIYKCDAYTSFYSNKLKSPLLVMYLLYKGGGSCSRKGLTFKGYKNTAHPSDYANSGYDIGHLANSEDFAYDCKKDTSTFRYPNAFAQTEQLNRGPWNTNEKHVRDWSKIDSLFILIGGFYGNKTIGNGVHVPDTCWKIVYNIKQKVVVQATSFTNTSSPIRTDWPYEKLRIYIEKRYNIHINNFIPK